MYIVEIKHNQLVETKYIDERVMTLSNTVKVLCSPDYYHACAVIAGVK